MTDATSAELARIRAAARQDFEAMLAAARAARLAADTTDEPDATP
jgi:hypothetical protein